MTFYSGLIHTLKDDPLQQKKSKVLRAGPLSLVLFCLFFMGILSGCTESKPVSLPYEGDLNLSRTEAEEDFSELKDLMDSLHPKLYTDIDALNRLYQAQYAKIKGDMTRVELLQLAAPVVAALKCGHTSLNLPQEQNNQLIANDLFFPMTLAVAENKLYVTETGPITAIPVGSEIVTINGQTSSDCLNQLQSSLPADGDNLTLKTLMIGHNFRYFYHLYMGNPKDFIVEYLPPGESQSVTASLPAVTKQTIEDTGILFWTSEEQEPFSSHFESDYAVLKINSFYPYGAYDIEAYKIFFRTFFKTVQDNKLQHVILDVRNNGGGDPYVTADLLSYLQKAPVPYFNEEAMDYYSGLKDPIPMAEMPFKGQLYILLNGSSFSSTGHLLALLKHQNIGVMIGEESGGSFACTDSSEELSLSHSELQFRFSTQVWQVAVDPGKFQPGRGVMPDYDTPITLKDLLNHTDPAMTKALELLHE